ncbi:MAG: hypothetical protein ACRC0A_04415 [Chitinophagaceae bacterium]
MKKKILFIVFSIAILSILISIYSLWQQQQTFDPTKVYSICIWGDSTATTTIQYIAKSTDSNKIIEEKNIPMVRKKSKHPLEQWNMIVIKPTYFSNLTNLPFEIAVSAQNKEKVYVAVFDNDSFPYWNNDSFLVFHLLMLRSAYDNNPDVAVKSLEEWIKKSSLLKETEDSIKNLRAQALWKKVQTIDKDSIAHYLETIHYPLFKTIDPNEDSAIILKK